MATDGVSRLSVGVSVMVALSLAVFLTIVILLLADLFCSHLRRRRLRADAIEAPPHKWPKHGHGGAGSSSPPHITGTADDASVSTTARGALTSTPPFYYAHGVMCAPTRKDLLLAIPRLEAAVWRWSPARRSSPSPSPPRSDEPTARGSSSSAHSDGLMYISNPVYERGAAAGHGHDTPFETPDASPSRCGITEEERGDGAFSPPLPMMRKLPPLGVLACPPPAVFDGRPPVTLWPGTVADANRASSSSSNFTARFFSS
ncbi:uncharacterized protein LOC119352200 [Triticum dicoccoides]|uniref:Uncharacterized protein n=1 Tax=Triticum turgidum subsp. durum TaxID=4567 RepID=A0A9R1RDZ1_TRITD|nr:uncharacterized protein LOC119352200 [Triticum dicoccoides]VAH37917.1 unnamed protein product [Triticum turgidum subsp. durum]